MRVLELRGFKSIRALNTFSTLMLGIKQLPAYMGESYEDFLGRLQVMDRSGQEKIIREAILFVPLQQEEVEAVTCFCADANGVPYTAENLKSLPMKDIHEIITAVCMEVAKIKIDLIGEDEKKK